MLFGTFGQNKTITRRTVFHVSSSGKPPNLSGKPPRSASHDSLEGIGLSVSLHPDEWRMIARLGDEPAFKLARIDQKAGRFLVWSATLDDTAGSWAVGAGWLSAVVKWRINYLTQNEDDETEERYSYTYDPEAEAEAIREYGDEVTQVEEIRSFTATKKLLKRWRAYFTTKDLSDGSAITEATNLYVAETYPELDGIWWLEELDPDALSAPRGVILPHAQSRWHVVGRENQRIHPAFFRKI